ncbi:hypothetical protein H0H92_011091 [Tricholoma furcatifolium]|nr:hypothetical protein H0H92_011091 [Tricholoma furcatifolium]
MALNTESSAAVVFLILYAILFVLLIVGYATRRLKLRSRFTAILVHVTIRLAAQGTGLAFGIVGYQDVGLLIAYFVLGAEGYFSLVLCAYRFLINWQYHNLEAHDSWLEPRLPPGTPFRQRLQDSFTLFGRKRRPMAVMHYLLIAANIIIIVGGSKLSNTTASNYASLIHQAKILRTVGQAIFLTMNCILLVCILLTMRQYHREQLGTKVHRSLFLLLAAWPFLFVRGIYGIMSSIYNPFNYFYWGNYGANGLKDSFVITEYVLSTAMEWSACALLMSTYITSRNDPPKPPLEKWEGGKELQASMS